MPRVLVIEADINLCKAIHAILEIAGYEVICTHDGQAGIEQARAMLPHVILCDAKLPRRDGYEVLAALRQDAATAGIPFILMAVYLSKADMKRALSLGADSFIIKPFTENELLRKIETSLP